MDEIHVAPVPEGTRTDPFATETAPIPVPVLVTTVHRGIFFGYVDSPGEVQGETVTLRDARNCLYWSPQTRGFLGLASRGPDSDCRVGPKARSLTLRNVTAVAEVSTEAVERWEAGPWKN